MQSHMNLYFNILFPLVTGGFSLLYFVHFVLTNPSRAVSYRFFVIFLVGFSIFMIGRPLQLLAGPHPLPLIIVNIRVFILCTIVAPLAMLTSNIFKRGSLHRREYTLYTVCALLGLIYVIFNTLGTKASYTVAAGNWLTVHDNLTPSGQAPFYPREVTLAVQILIGGMLVFFSLTKLVFLKRNSRLRGLFTDKNFFINTGILIFGASFTIGSLIQQWWVYYAFSIASTLFIGASVIMDLKEMQNWYEKLVPFLKEDILCSMTDKSTGATRIRDMLKTLGKKTVMDTFVVIECAQDARQMKHNACPKIQHIVHVHAARRLNEESFLVVPLSFDRIGIVLSMEKPGTDSEYELLELIEDIHREVRTATGVRLKTGIGDTCSSVENLGQSYFAALNALDFAHRIPETDIMHANTLADRQKMMCAYPLQEKQQLLSAIKVGDRETASEAAKTFSASFQAFISENPDVLQVRLYELAGSLIDAAILGGGNEAKLTELATRYFSEITRMENTSQAGNWITEIVSEISGTVGRDIERRSHNLILQAQRYIEMHYGEQIGYKDVAREICISPSYFLNLFKKETGVTFTDCLARVRMQKARELLHASTLTVGEVAAAVGYLNSNYFSSLFSRMFGQSPTEFRKMNEEEGSIGPQ